MDLGRVIGDLASLYLQDEWHISEPLTLNYGLRYDHVDAYIREQQWSPRLNLAYKASDTTSLQMALHINYIGYVEGRDPIYQTIPFYYEPKNAHQFLDYRQHVPVLQTMDILNFLFLLRFDLKK